MPVSPLKHLLRMHATPFTVSTPRVPFLLQPAIRRGIPVKATVSTFEAESVRVASVRNSPSLYEVLRVERTASQREIKGAYRNLAKVYHPDVNGRSDGEQSDGMDFMEIRNAYETLSDPAARAMYDMSSSDSTRSRRSRPIGFSGGYCPSRRWETDQCW